MEINKETVKQTDNIPKSTVDNASSAFGNGADVSNDTNLCSINESLQRLRVKIRQSSFAYNLTVLIFAACMVTCMMIDSDLHYSYTQNSIMLALYILSVPCLFAAIVFGNLTAHARLSINKIDMLLEKHRLEKYQKAKMAEYDGVKEIDNAISDLVQRSAAIHERARTLYEIEIYSFAAGAFFGVAYAIAVWV